jgi:hypothetical protein
MASPLAVVLAALAVRVAQREKGLRSEKQTAALGSDKQPLAKDGGTNGETNDSQRSV